MDELNHWNVIIPAMSTIKNRKLLDKVKEFMRLHHCFIHTERTYWDPNNTGAIGSAGCFNQHDLHACAQARGSWGGKPPEWSWLLIFSPFFNGKDHPMWIPVIGYPGSARGFAAWRVKWAHYITQWYLIYRLSTYNVTMRFWAQNKLADKGRWSWTYWTGKTARTSK